MRADLRIGIAAPAAALALAFTAPVQAQETEAAGTTQTPATDAIGPRELQNFSLNGTVTRPAEEATAPPRPTQPAGNEARPSAAASTPARSTPAPNRITPTEERAAAAVPAPVTPIVEQPSQPSVDTSSARSVTVALPPAGSLADASLTDSSEGESGFAASALPEPGDGPSPLPWLLALSLLGAGGAFYYWRQKSQPRLAAAGGYADSFAAPPAQERKPLQRPPQPAAAPPPPAPAPASLGIVSTRLRPWIEIEFRPIRCIIAEDKATVEFEIALFNSGSAAARDVLVEGAMFNAGPDQDKAIGAFFANPVAQGDRLASIQPLKKVMLQSAVHLTRDQIRLFEAAGRQLFVPLAAFNVLYRWGGGEGQTSTSYLVGRDTKGEKMAPFRMDLGPRLFRGLAAREHAVRVRK